MSKDWKDVWNRRSAVDPAVTQVDLDQLIKLDGFDTGVGRIDVADWRINAERIAQRLKLKDGDSVYEVGCGSGAFLYALRERHRLSVGGLDYSASLIQTATRVMPDGAFHLGDARRLEIAPTYDYVVSNGMLMYCDFQDAPEIVSRMIQKARHAVAFMETPDLATKEESEAQRRGILGQKEYEEKYAGLGHTYFERAWFKQIAEERRLDCEIFGSCVPGGVNSSLRFNCIMWLA